MQKILPSLILIIFEIEFTLFYLYHYFIILIEYFLENLLNLLTNI
jgi:hypothetical protein